MNACNLNNEICLPFSLLRLADDSRFAVLEMGAGKPGDIDYLARIARPEIALVNNVAPAHLERMGSEQGVAETKRDLELMLDLSELGEWRPPIVTAVATDGTGVPDVWDAVRAHRAFMDKSGGLEQRRAERTRRELRQIVANRLEKRAHELLSGMTYGELEQSVLDRELDPWAAADVLLREVDA